MTNDKTVTVSRELASERTLRRNHAARIHELSDQTKELQQRLAAAEQRNAELVASARNVLQAYDSGDISDALDSLSAALAKPTESGASR